MKRVVGLTELESVTSCVSSRRSNQLSYGPRDPQYITRGLKIRTRGADAGVEKLSLILASYPPCCQ